MKSRNYPDLTCLTSYAIRAGKIMRKYFPNSPMAFEWKQDRTPVSRADKEINQLMRKIIRRDFPHIPLIGEEGCYKVPGAEYVIVEDSIDGTIGYIAGLPVATFCMTVLYGGYPLAAVIYDPFLKRMWLAEKGVGAFLNGRPVAVVPDVVIKQASISMIWWKGSLFHIDRACGVVQEAGAKTMNLCSVAICGGLIASGLLHASIFPGTKVWETAAMQLIVEEAGGKATDVFGKPLVYYHPEGQISGHIISCCGRLHDELLKIMADAQGVTPTT